MIMKNNSSNKKTNEKSIVYWIVIACIIVTGLFLISQVNVLVGASLNQDQSGINEINQSQDKFQQANGSFNALEKSHDIIRNGINVSFADAANVA